MKISISCFLICYALCLYIAFIVSDDSVISYTIDASGQNINADHSQTVTCQNGEIIQWKDINDDYCDCGDGSDEPKTSACSFYNTIAFYCKNENVFGKYIHSSRVNDGICDCCDGSDESINVCNNTCTEEISKMKENDLAEFRDIEKGYTERKERLAWNNEREKEMAHEKNEINKSIERVKGLKKVVKLYLDLEEQVDYEEHSKRLAEDAYNDNIGSIEEPTEKTTEKSVKEDESNDNETWDISYIKHGMSSDAEDFEFVSEMLQTQMILSNGKRISLRSYMFRNLNRLHRKLYPNAKDMRENYFLGPLFNGGREGRIHGVRLFCQALGLLLSPLRAVFEMSRYVSKMISLFVYDEDITENTLSEWMQSIDPQESVSFRRLYNGRLYKIFRIMKWMVKEAWNAPIVVYLRYQKLDAVRNETKTLRDVIASAEKKIEDLQNTLKANEENHNGDFGPDSSFSYLQNKCFSKTIEKYNYEVCLFKSVKQDGFTLGKFKRWGNQDNDNHTYASMYFANGDMCPGGISRSSTVLFFCGSEDKILSVSESVTCIYEIKFATPSACTEQVYENKKSKIIRWEEHKND